MMSVKRLMAKKEPRFASDENLGKPDAISLEFYFSVKGKEWRFFGSLFSGENPRKEIRALRNELAHTGMDKPSAAIVSNMAVAELNRTMRLG